MNYPKESRIFHLPVEAHASRNNENVGWAIALQSSPFEGNTFAARYYISERAPLSGIFKFEVIHFRMYHRMVYTKSGSSTIDIGALYCGEMDRSSGMGNVDVRGIGEARKRGLVLWKQLL